MRSCWLKIDGELSDMKDFQPSNVWIQFILQKIAIDQIDMYVPFKHGLALAISQSKLAWRELDGLCSQREAYQDLKNQLVTEKGNGRFFHFALFPANTGTMDFSHLGVTSPNRSFSNSRVSGALGSEYYHGDVGGNECLDVDNWCASISLRVGRKGYGTTLGRGGTTTTHV